MTPNEIRRVLAERLWLESKHNRISTAVRNWRFGYAASMGVTDEEYRDPLESHDTIHAIEEVLSAEEWELYWNVLEVPAFKAVRGMFEWPDGLRVQLAFRHAPARVLAEALARVVGGRKEEENER